MKEIKFKDLDWYVIEETDDSVKLLLKNVLDEERIKKYSNDDWYVDGYEVRLTSDVKPPFDWEKSYVKNVILENFKNDLGIECDITIPSKEDVENLPYEIRKCVNWYWTNTPSHFLAAGAFAHVYLVNPTGELNLWLHVAYSNGVRPIITLKKELCTEQ